MVHTAYKIQETHSLMQVIIWQANYSHVWKGKGMSGLMEDKNN
jgi:hypothetical protein